MAARKGFGGVGGFGYHQMPVNQPMTEAEMNISTNTSSTNLKDKRSRIFIGNLNTFRVTKADVEEIFSYYGYIKGCSVHKGYAFVQYTNEADARAAATSEDGRMLAGQVLDVNIASEPKPNQKPPGQGPTKRGAPSTNWGSGVGMDFQSDPNYTGFDQPPPLMGGPPAKRPRPGMMGKPKMGTQNRPKALATVAAAASVMPSISGSTDILICGMCKQVFSNMAVLQAHKTQGCQLKFVCKCSELAGELTGPAKPSSWVCILCPETFEGAWPLMYHAQTQHGTSIFQDNPEIKEEEEELKDEESAQNSQNGNGEEEQQQAAIEEQN